MYLFLILDVSPNFTSDSECLDTLFSLSKVKQSQKVLINGGNFLLMDSIMIKGKYDAKAEQIAINCFKVKLVAVKIIEGIYLVRKK